MCSAQSASPRSSRRHRPCRLRARRLIGFGDFYTIAIALTVFYECPELVNAWISSVAISFVITWLVQDPMWILFRNNCFATKKRIRTAKYQFAEKVAAGPLRALAHAVASL